MINLGDTLQRSMIERIDLPLTSPFIEEQDFAETAAALGWIRDGIPQDFGLRTCPGLKVMQLKEAGKTKRGFLVSDIMQRSASLHLFGQEKFEDEPDRSSMLHKESDLTWPIGLRTPDQLPATVLVAATGEDLLAACAFAARSGKERDVRIVLVPEGAASLHPDALKDLRSSTLIFCVNTGEEEACRTRSRLILSLREARVRCWVLDLGALATQGANSINALWIASLGGGSIPNPVVEALSRLSGRTLISAPDFIQSHYPASPSPEEPPAPGHPFPFDAFKGPSAELAAAVANAKPVPHELPYLVALSITGALCGKRIEATNHVSRHSTPGNLFIVASAKTGAGKSIAAKELIAPLRHLEREVIEDWETRRAALQLELRRLNERAKGPRVALKPDRGTAIASISDADEKRRQDIERQLEKPKPRWLDTAPTPEALIESMATFNESGFVFTTEGEAMLQLMDGKRAKSAARFGEYCGLFSGDATGGSRISRDTASLANPRLSAFIAIQPDLARELRFSEISRVRGLAGRFVWATFSAAREIDPDKPNPTIETTLVDRHEAACRALFSRYVDPHASMHAVEVSLNSEAAWHVHRRAADDQRKVSANAPFADIRVRGAELITKMALGLHLMEHGVAGERIEITLDTVQGAERLYEWALSAWLPAESDSELDENEKHARKILATFEKYKGPLTARDLYRALGLPAEDGKRVVQFFVAREILEEVPDPASKTTRYVLIAG